MIRNSFCFLPGISHRSEHNIWQNGINDWQQFIDCQNIPGISSERKQTHDSLLKHANSQLVAENAVWFGNIVPKNQHWRLYDNFVKDSCYLDIETDGYYGNITVVGIYDGKETYTFVKGKNLDKAEISKVLGQSKILLTFNGSSFDLPVIERYFNLRPDMPHIDLRHVCSKIGLTGGLKKIEQTLGIARPEEVQGITGMEAVILWQKYKQTQNEKYLELLIDYNTEDIVNLPKIAQRVIPAVWENIKVTKSN